MAIIETENLGRTFKKRVALDGISFHVEAGEVFGCLGPNGAGKTTTIRILTGQLVPSGGNARVAGFDCDTQSDRIKPLVGVVFEQQNLYERMSGRENLEFFASLYGAPRSRVEDTLAQVGLADRARDPVKAFSNGMRQRLMIARALLNQPRILFLDEPTRGLDPGVARDIRRSIIDLCRGGTTVFLTTHYMEEADQLCDRVAFLNEGRIVALDTPQNIKIAHGRRRVKTLLKAGEPRELTLSLELPEDIRRLNEALAAGNVLTMHTEEATLEDVFIELAGRRLLQGDA